MYSVNWTLKIRLDAGVFIMATRQNRPPPPLQIFEILLCYLQTFVCSHKGLYPTGKQNKSSSLFLTPILFPCWI